MFTTASIPVGRYAVEIQLACLQRTLEFDSCRPLVTQLFNIACELQGMLYCFVACETEIEISFMCGQLASC